MYRRGFREDHDDHVPLNEQPATPAAAHFGAEDIGWTAFGPSIALSVLATLVVVLRFYTRARLVHLVGWDDYVILLSLLLCWTICGLIGAAVEAGIGSYHTYPGAIDTMLIVKLIVATNTVWAVTVNITKASILIQYLRVFDGRVVRICCWTLMFALLPSMCWGVFGGISLCTPTAKLWNIVLKGHCRNAQRYWTSVAGVNIGLDFFTLFLPMPAIAGLHLPRKQKLLTTLVFFLGFFVCIVSCVRLSTVVVTADKGDPVMSGMWAIIWSAVEANVGIICASLLALRAFVVKLFPKIIEETEPTKHQMRLPTIDSMEAIWHEGNNQVTTLGASGAASWPPTPSSGHAGRFSGTMVYKIRVGSTPEDEPAKAKSMALHSRSLDSSQFLRHDSQATAQGGQT